MYNLKNTGLIIRLILEKIFVIVRIRCLQKEKFDKSTGRLEKSAKPKGFFVTD